MTDWAVAHIAEAMTKTATLKAVRPEYSDLIKRADRLARHNDKLGVSPSTRIAVSAAIFNEGKKLDRLADGGDVYHSVFVAAGAKLEAMEQEAGL